MDIKLTLRDRTPTPEEQKWLSETAAKIQPIFKNFSESEEYKNFIEEQWVELTVHGIATYTIEDLQEVITEYQARVNAN